MPTVSRTTKFLVRYILIASTNLIGLIFIIYDVGARYCFQLSVSV